MNDRENKNIAFSSVNGPNEKKKEPIDATKAVDNAFRYQEELIKRQASETINTNASMKPKDIAMASKMLEEITNKTNNNQEINQNIVKEQPNKIDNEEKEVKEEKKIVVKKHMKKGVKKIITILILLIILTISSTVFFKYYLINPKIITKKALVELKDKTDKIINIDNPLKDISDTYSINAKVKTSLETTLENNEKNKNYITRLNNLNNGTTTLILKQNIDEKKLYANINTKVQDKVLINDKYLIQNSTEYYFVNGFINTYINNGNNHYFETISESNDYLYNIDYLYTIITEEIADSIEDDYYTITNTTTMFYEKKQKVRKVSIKLDNKKLVNIVNNVIEKLKKDKTANNIMTGLIDDFSNYKVDKKQKFIDDKDEIVINIFASGLKNDIEKYELIYTKDNVRHDITYENYNKTLTVSENNKVKNYYVFNYRENNLKIGINDKNKEELGVLSIEKNDNKTVVFLLNYKDDNYNIGIDINKKMNSKSNCTIKGNVSIIKDKIKLLQGDFDIEATIENKAEINENVDNVTFASEISDEKYNELNNLLENRLIR